MVALPIPIHVPVRCRHALPFDVYAPEVEVREQKDVPPADKDERRPVVAITRQVSLTGELSMPEAWLSIRKGRRVTHDLWIDQGIRVVVFEAE